MRLLSTREVRTALLATGVGLAAVVGAGLLGWPGAPFDCASNPCYCELPTAGFVRQVGNTWSNLGAVFAGLLVAVRSARERAQREAEHRPSAAHDVLGLLAPPALVFQGVGSMFFHGGLTQWGSALDAMSMFAIAGLLALTQAVRLGWLDVRGLVRGWGLLTLGGLMVGLWSPPLVATLMFGLFLSILATEVVLSRRGRSPRPSLFRIGLATHVGAIAVWFLSAGEGLPLCAPHSIWQGHGLWHLAAAGAVTLMVLHLQRNLDRGPATATG
ncbi:MAG: ceramidase domain-containing protein [Archangium sp.]|nr:ceramidase domain-containing protein [Archangium sp.]